MIENFALLVARCQAARLRRMIRIALITTGGVLFLTAGISAYRVWFVPGKMPDVPTVSKQAVTSPQNPKPTLPAADELNETSSLEASAQSVSSVAPATKKPQPVSAATAVVAPADRHSAAEPPSSKSPAVAVESVENAVPPIPSAASALFEVNTQNALNPADVYFNNPKYETAMAAARDFYAKENFIDAAIWAKKANRINREGEESWLLYAKAMHAQGRTAEAIGILELYLNYKNSKAAAELIRTWR